MTGERSPWHGIPLEQLHRSRHIAASCKVCGPMVATPAWQRGVERADRRIDVLPLTSSEPDSRPGRDGYELT